MKGLARNYKKIILICALTIIYLTFYVNAFPIGECTPDPCPEGYVQGERICNNGICTVSCNYYNGCDNVNTTAYEASEYLPDLNIPSYEGTTSEQFNIGRFPTNDTSKCYRFRHTTPNNFIFSSDIDDYSSTTIFDSGIALYWEDFSTDSIWYDNQNYFTLDVGDGYEVGDQGYVWVDSCNDDGDNFDSADNLANSNYLYCAPTEEACDDFNSTHCDTDCYGYYSALVLDLDTDLQNGLNCNDFSSFEGISQSPTSPEIDFVYFDNQTIHMFVDEFDAILEDTFNNTCNYQLVCNPADPCCDLSGNFRPSGYVCKSAHDAVCTDSASCGGTANEDRCTGTSSECPDNNYAITYDKACDDQICVAQSCSNSTLQPQRTCYNGACQVNDPYDCPYNLNCQDSYSCKLLANSSSDCRDGYTYDSVNDICWLDTGIDYELIYDQNGNLISGLGLNYTYDDFNLLTSIIDSETGEFIANYSYDYNGIRIKSVDYSGNENTTTYYVDNFIQIVNSSGTYNETYYYYNSELVGKKNVDDSLYFFHPDYLGSTTLITDINGNVIADLRYEPFGQPLDQSNERFSYTGHQLDLESGNIYMKARYYNPELGLFLQPDSFVGNVYNPQDLNKYAYVRNNPYKYVDETGNIPVVPLAIIAFPYILKATFLVSNAIAVLDLVEEGSSEGLGFSATSKLVRRVGFERVAKGVGYIGLLETTKNAIKNQFFSDDESDLSLQSQNNILQESSPSAQFTPIKGISGSSSFTERRPFDNNYRTDTYDISYEEGKVRDIKTTVRSTGSREIVTREYHNDNYGVYIITVN